MPERFELTYTDADNTEKTPVMIHRAILGSLERFIGILIEEHAGRFPTWLAPVQVRILNITSAYIHSAIHGYAYENLGTGEKNLSYFT